MSTYNDGKFLLVWSFASLLTGAIPLVIFMAARLANSDNGEGYSSSEQNQANNYQANQANQATQYQYDNGCYWWQWGCDESYQAQNAQELQDQTPWWWLWSEDERRNDDSLSPTLIIIYCWTLVVLLVLTIYGRRSVVTGGSLHGVAACCFMFANYSFVSMLYIGGLKGAVSDDADNLDEDGWYGQFGVLLYLTHFTCTIFGVTYYFAFRRLAAEKEITKVELQPSDYMNYEEHHSKPSVVESQV